MELYPLDPLGLHPELADAASVHATFTRQPRTVAEILGGALKQMEAEDQAEAYRADPITYIRAQRARRTLWSRLFGRR